MKKVIRIFALVLFLPGAIILPGCGGGSLEVLSEEPPEEPPEESSPDYLISDNYNAINMMENVQVTEVTDDTVTYEFTGEPPTLAPGQIIGSEEGDGFLRKITSVSYSGNSVVVETEQAALTDAVEEGDFLDSIDLSNLVLVKSLEGVRVSKAGIPLNNVTIFSAGGLTVKIPSGNIAFDTELDIGARIRRAKVQDFHAIAGGSMAVDLELQASASQTVSLGKEISIAQFQSVAFQFIGPVPVVEVITLDFVVGFDASMTGTLTATSGVQGSASVRFGAQYDGTSWSGVREASKNFSSDPPTFSGSAGLTLRGYVRPSITVKFYGILGPSLGLEPYLQFDGTLVSGPALDWVLSAGVDVVVAFEISLLGKDIARFDWYINIWSLDLASGSLGASYNLTGIWDTVEYEDPGPTPGHHVMTFTQSGSTISGTWDTISLSGSLSGDTVTITTTTMVPITYTGTIAIASGNTTISGTYGDPIYIGAWSATKR